MARIEVLTVHPEVAVEVEVVVEPVAEGSGAGILLVAKTTTGCIFGGSVGDATHAAVEIQWSK